MKKFEIGPGLKCDLDVLINTRLLVQANSGAGKSWALRRLLEQTSGHIQHLVIDPEGEFASLREKFDYVLAARNGGDTLADPRVAKMLAERLLELGVSAILDIYELKAHERTKFVRTFLEALVDAPKKLWHPALVVLDEAHVFCPQQGEAESGTAVIDLATRGRKRGFCLVLATQRLSKLHKDAAAECNNKLIGRSALDVDMDRAGDELGFKKGDRQVLRELDAGEFYAFGPALSQTVIKVKVGAVVTSHPKAGSRLAGVVPPPTDKVKSLLPKLADLPAEAEARERTVADLKRENAELKRQLTTAQKAGLSSTKITLAPDVKSTSKPVLTDADRALLEKLAAELKSRAVKATELIAAAESRADRLVQTAVAEYLNTTRNVGTETAVAVSTMVERVGLQKILTKLEGVATTAPDPGGMAGGARPARVTPSPSRPAPRPIARGEVSSNGHGTLTPAKQKILNGLAFLHGIGVAPADKTQLALIVGVSPTSGGYFNNLGNLRSEGLIDYPTSGTVALTDTGAPHASTDGVPSTTDELHEAIRAKLPAAKWKIVEALIGVYPKAMTKDALAEHIGVSPTSGGFFNNLGSLRTLGLVDYPRPGQVVATSVLFLEGAA